ncbi:MAG: UDP-N-acetylmuramate dehydrogenase [Treponema sp.]|jgi:UDP-N-acetylmuramate dehydrogenase|nr:UDP-N-acetylmuramate dehydrogenase [Treponema sp.]
MRNEFLAEIINKCLVNHPCEIEVRYDEPMKEHTTFKVGGLADCWIGLKPSSDDFSNDKYTSFFIELLSSAKEAGIPVFILGGGANIVVSDKGIRGIVLDMTEWKSLTPSFVNENELIFRSGTSLNDAANLAYASGLSGLEFLAGMPGTIGGAVWMNARCYGSEIADVLSRVELINKEQRAKSKEQSSIDKSGFSYKKSPFQEMDCLILNAAFKLKKGDKDKILAQMEKNRQDRKDKGHYLFPSAGSAFKNNPSFGKPSGQIIDELGLKGYQIGGAQIAPFHGNFIINTGNAAAADIRLLVDEVIAKVKTATGHMLEPEILFVGDW